MPAPRIAGRRYLLGKCLGFPSRSTLSFAALCFCSFRVSLPGFHPSRNPLSWIIGVHKVLYSVSNFYSKNSALQQPCSHGAFLSVSSAQNPLCPTYSLLRYFSFFFATKRKKSIYGNKDFYFKDNDFCRKIF